MRRQQWTLVTGASGFIGSALVRRLVERGEHVKAFVRPGANLEPFVDLPRDRLQLAFGDILVSHTVYRALASCDRLYHVASAFKYTSSRPADVLDPAVVGTSAVLEAARRRDLEHVVVTSSTAVLGTIGSEQNDPMDETHANNLTDPELYVRAKLEAAEVVQRAVERGQPIISVLPGAVFGPGDWKPTPNGKTLIDYLKLSPGRKIPVTDGGISVVDVDDVVEGHIAALEKGRPGERYILGGENLTFREFVRLLHELTGLAEPGGTPSAGLVELAGRALEFYSRWAKTDAILTRKLARDYAFARVWVSSRKAERELGYTHRPARETLARAVRYFLASHFVPDTLARRVRLELRPA